MSGEAAQPAKTQQVKAEAGSQDWPQYQLKLTLEGALPRLRHSQAGEAQGSKARRDALWRHPERAARGAGHEKGVAAVKFSDNGNRLASASADRTCRVWDPITGYLLATLQGHTMARPLLGHLPRLPCRSRLCRACAGPSPLCAKGPGRARCKAEQAGGLSAGTSHAGRFRCGLASHRQVSGHGV